MEIDACQALALYFLWYNWVRNHKTLGVTRAMAAGLVQTPLEFTDLLTVDNEEQNKIADKRQAIIEESEQLSRVPQSN